MQWWTPPASSKLGCQGIIDFAKNVGRNCDYQELQLSLFIISEFFKIIFMNEINEANINITNYLESKNMASQLFKKNKLKMRFKPPPTGFKNGSFHHGLKIELDSTILRRQSLKFKILRNPFQQTWSGSSTLASFIIALEKDERLFLVRQLSSLVQSWRRKGNVTVEVSLF